MIYKLLSVPIVCILLTAIQLPAFATKEENLLSVGKDTKDNEYLINLNQSKMIGNDIIDYVYKMRLAKPDNSGVIFVHVNSIGYCQANKTGMKSIQLYNDQNEIVGKQEFTAPEIDKVKPESPAEVILQAACQAVDKKTQSNQAQVSR